MRLVLPLFPDALVRPALLAPASFALTRSLRRVMRSNPDLVERLKDFEGARIMIAPRSWPLVFLITLRIRCGSIEVLSAETAASADVRVEAPISVLWKIFEGLEDGDTAFFSSDLTIEGEVASLLALRNAIDAAGLNWTALVPVPVPRTFARLIDRLRAEPRQARHA